MAQGVLGHQHAKGSVVFPLILIKEPFNYMCIVFVYRLSRWI